MVSNAGDDEGDDCNDDDDDDDDDDAEWAHSLLLRMFQLVILLMFLASVEHGKP